MSLWLGRVTVIPKPSVNDPQGLAVLDGLHALGFSEVEQVRVGRHIDVRLDAEGAEEAEARLCQMCETLLANTLIESYEVQVQPVQEGAAV
ncbi:MAG: phosphoribosylformylglycinamidine synthase subunit PurS [Chloroflexota bacterium]|nr:phosphoribosylformylglycinamidine synthase subunit PurS [Chloroflexota bacterium]